MPVSIMIIKQLPQAKAFGVSRHAGEVWDS